MRRRRAVDQGAGIQGLVAAFEDGAAALRNRLAQLRAETAVIERALASVTGNGTPVRRGPGRPRKVETSAMATTTPAPRATRKAGKGRRAKGQDLASMIEKVLAGAKGMGIAEIVEGVKKAGYVSSSPSFARIVGMRLMDKKKFKRVDRGVYAMAK